MATSIPHEFWATGSKLQWMDTRGELCGRRQAWAGPPAERTCEQIFKAVTSLPRALSPKAMNLTHKVTCKPK
eukprot:2340906-Amphidinium_carterae.1